MNFIEGDWGWDCETYPNVFTACFIYGNGKGERVFEVSDRKNDTEEMLSFLRKIKNHNHRLVGFNNLGFDYQVLHFILERSKKANIQNKQISIAAKEIYDVAMKLIKMQDQDKFGNLVSGKDIIIPQVDLFKIHHFDNKAKSTSLKMLEFNMRSDNIEDLPFPVGRMLTSEEIDVLIDYNKHDVRQTLKFYYASLDAINFRKELTLKYGFDCTNYNDTRIGKEYFINKLEKEVPGSCYKRQGPRRVVNQTKRDIIHIKDVIFPYVKFDRPEFNSLLDWFKSQSITETIGVFTDILESNLEEVAEYAQLKTKRKKLPNAPTLEEELSFDSLSWVEEVALKSKKNAKSYWLNWNVAETLNVVIDGFRYDFGVGGLHGSLENSIIESTEDRIIVDADVASYYPNLAISNRVYPKHLTERFCDIYKDVYESRKSYPKGSPENAVMKLALNGTYGDSNNQYSPFYDPQYTMAITVNGQLSLCILIEKLLTIDGLKLCQCNTDGLTVEMNKKDLDVYKQWIEWWESLTKLEMELNFYSKMIIRDVNNYIAVYEDGKIKRKGTYEYHNLEWHKNQSALVVPMAVEQELVYGRSAEDFIRKHDNKWDFMLRTKVPRSSRLVMVMEDKTEILQQNICRYYPSESGGKLIKIMPALPGKEEDGERRLSIDKEWNVKTCNDINDFNWDINYDYYISEAKKLIDIFYQEN